MSLGRTIEVTRLPIVGNQVLAIDLLTRFSHTTPYLRSGMAVAGVCVLATLFPRASLAQAPGDSLPSEVAAHANAVRPELARALAEKDEPATYAAVGKLREALGKYAGVPESPEKYVTPVNTEAPSLQTLTDGWQKLFDGPLTKRGCRSESAQKHRMELRESAKIALACLAMAEVDAAKAELYKARAHEELDYLLGRQAKTGLFPFPAFPAAGGAPKLAAVAEQVRLIHPDAIVDGYIVLDIDGGAQFDTGCCAYALIQGYKAFTDERYLAAARRAGDWAVNEPLVANWNYNSFSVWQLAALYNVTRETKYLDASAEKALIGVLPGLMDSGRWVDPHNAKQTYHFIMVRALTELARVLPHEHPRYTEIHRKLVLAADARARDILRDGASDTESALAGLSTLLRDSEPSSVWQDAANAIANAMIASKKPDPISMADYIRWRAYDAHRPKG